jgi:uncharacterized protein YhfF
VTELPEFGLGYPGTDLRRRLVEAVLAGEKTATAGLYGEDPPTREGERFQSVDDWRVAHERFFERPIPAETLIEAIRFRVEERL